MLPTRTAFYYVGLTLLLIKAATVIVLLNPSTPNGLLYYAWVLGKIMPTAIGLSFLIDSVIMKKKRNVYFWGAITAGAFVLTMLVISPWWPFGAVKI